jgi:hypothetical protein
MAIWASPFAFPIKGETTKKKTFIETAQIKE